MLSVIDWLNGEYIIARVIIETREVFQQKLTRLERLAELIYCNGGQLQVTGFGEVKRGGVYGRLGLVMPEALELINLGGIISGFLLSWEDDVENEESGRKAGSVQNMVIDCVKKEVARVEKEGFDPRKGKVEGSDKGRIEIVSPDVLKKLDKGKPGGGLILPN